MAFGMDDIKYFIKVNETKNVTRAAEILGITQPTLSYSIKRLEREIGGDLLIRLKSGIQLTKLGEEFIKRSRKLIFEWDEIQKIVDPVDSEMSGNYTIAIHPSVALYTLDKFLPELSKRYPGVNINFLHGLSREMTEKIISWEADFGIVVNPIAHPDLVIKKLCTDVVTIFSKKNAVDKLIYDGSLTQTQFILKNMKKFKDKFHGEIKTSNLEVASSLTSQGLGHGLLPSRVAGLHKNLSPLKGAPTFQDQICLVYRPEKHKNKLSRKIIKIISEGEF